MNRHDYEKLSESIVDNVEEGGSLEDGIVGAAKDRSLNPEQVRRLIEMTNTNAFLKLFKSLSGDDRMVDFDVADPSSVIKKYYAGGSPKIIKKTVIISMSGSDDSDFFGDIKDELRSSDEPELAIDEGVEEKTASFTEPVGIPKFKKLRLREALTDKIAAAEYKASDIARELASSFRGIYSREKLASFEADCVSLHGNTALPALTALRQSVGMDSLDYSNAKTAAKNRVVDASSSEFSKVAEYLGAVDKYTSYSKALDLLENLEELPHG